MTEPRQAGNPLQNTPDPGATVGADLKYAVTPALTLTATVNPDFGQVEADPAVVNLSAFETFFQEKRPFFIEGSGTYQFECRDCSLFYSRRIGRQPRGFPDAGRRWVCGGAGKSTILGAAKLTGRVGKFSVGVLAAVTQEEDARRRFGVERWREVVEPRTFYSVSRARREFSDQSSLGFILTTTNRSSSIRCRSCPTPRSPAASTTTGASARAGGSTATGRPQRQRQRRSDRGAATQQRPQLSAAGRRSRRARSVRHVAERALRQRRVQQDRRRAHALERQRRLSGRRGST